MKRILKFFGWVIIFLLLYPFGYFVFDKTQDVNDTQSYVKGINTYIINLERSKDRYEYVKPNITDLGFPSERIEAVDGNLLSDSEIEKNVDLISYKEYLNHLPRKGMIGCNLSHYKAWEAFLKSNAEYAIIFEDDISFNPKELKPVIEEVIKYNNLWDIVNLEISHKGTPLTIKNLGNNHKLVIYLTEITHAGAYIINRKAADK